jgi:hypothetical protein
MSATKRRARQRTAWCCIRGATTTPSIFTTCTGFTRTISEGSRDADSSSSQGSAADVHHPGNAPGPYLGLAVLGRSRGWRKLLKKYGFVPVKLVTDDLRSYGAAASDLGIAKRHERCRWRNNRERAPRQKTGTPGGGGAPIGGAMPAANAADRSCHNLGAAPPVASR